MAAIYKRDLRSYFTSPVGYVFIATFVFVMNLVFYIMNMMTAQNQLTAVFSIMFYALIVLAPVLTMRTFSEEYKQKTDQLLLTSPVKPAGIVLGKFLAAYTVYVISLALLLIQVVIIAAVSTPNGAIIFGNYIALLAVGAVFIAIGCFVSSLTENQLVANIATLGINVFLFLIHLTIVLCTYIGAFRLRDHSDPEFTLLLFYFLNLFPFRFHLSRLKFH